MNPGRETAPGPGQEPRSPRRILHIDMDAFFAAVEEQRRPELAGKPVVIGGRGDPSQRGVVSTANYEARKYGIHSALPLQTAYRLCPRAVFLPVDYEAYTAASRRCKAVLRHICHIMEDVGIDEAYLDISNLDIPPEEVARRIKAGIREETNLTCSIGIAPNKLLAKIASDLEKPDGLTVLTMASLAERIWPLPVRKLIGIGPKTEARLKATGIETIAQLAALPLEGLTALFGSSYGHYLFLAARGIDDSPLVTHWEPKSISRETTFQKDVGDWQVLAKTLAGIARDVAVDMANGGYKARTITVKIRFMDFQTLTRAKSLPEATDDEGEIRRTAFACLGRVSLEKRVRLMGVRASQLVKIEGG